MDPASVFFPASSSSRSDNGDFDRLISDSEESAVEHFPFDTSPVISETVSLSQLEIEKDLLAESGKDKDLDDIIGEIKYLVSATPVMTPPAAAQSTNGDGRIAKLAKGLSIARSYSNLVGETDDAETLGLMADTAELITKAQDVFVKWWQQVVDFFRRAADKVADIATSVLKALRKVLSSVIEFVSASYENARKWFVSMSCVSGTEAAIPPAVADMSKPVNWTLNPNSLTGDFASDVSTVTSQFKTFGEAKTWINNVLTTYYGKNVSPANYVLYEIVLGCTSLALSQSDTASDAAFRMDPIYYTAYSAYARASRFFDGTEVHPCHFFISEPPHVVFKDPVNLRFPYRIPKESLPVDSQYNWLSLLDVSTLINFLTSLTASILGSLKASTDFFNAFDPTAFSVAFASFLSAFNNFKRSGLGDTIEWFIDKVVHFLSGRNFSTKYGMRRKWDAAVEGLNDSLKKATGVRNVSPVLVGQITNFVADLEDLFAGMMHFFPRETAGIKNQYDDLKRRAAQYDCGTVPMQRHKPVAFLLAGNAGTGKTSAQTAIINNLFAVVEAMVQREKNEEVDLESIRSIARNPSHFPYNCAETKADFDDGYKNNAFVTFEELGTITDPSITQEWITKFFRVIDREPLLCNMAFIDKGKRYMNSPVVIATTNCLKGIPGASSFSDIKAVHRRIEFHLLVEHPQDEEFDILKSKFTFTSECYNILQDKRLTPSRVLRKLITSNTIGRTLTIDQLVNAAALVYLERIHDFHSEKSRTIPLLPNFLKSSHAAFDGAPRNGKFTPAAVPTAHPTFIRCSEKINQIVVYVEHEELCHIQEYVMAMKVSPQVMAHLSVCLKTVLGEDWFERLSVPECFDKYTRRSSHHLFHYIGRSMVVSCHFPETACPRFITHVTQGIPSCQFHFQIVKVFDPKVKEKVTSQMDSAYLSWSAPPMDYKPSFYERFYYAKAFMNPTIELFHYDPSEIHFIVKDHLRKAREAFAWNHPYSYDVDARDAFDMIHKSVQRGVIGPELQDIYRGMQKLTKHYTQMRQRSMGICSDSTVAVKRKVIQDGMFVSKNIQALLWLTDTHHRTLAYQNSEDYWFVVLEQAIGEKYLLTAEQHRSLNHSLKFVGKQANRRGHVSNLERSKVLAYEKRVRANKQRSKTKNSRRIAVQQKEKELGQKSRADIDRRVGKKRALQTRRMRDMKATRMESQINKFETPPEQILAKAIGWISGIDNMDMIFKVTVPETIGLWFSRNYIKSLVDRQCKRMGKNTTDMPYLDIFFACSGYLKNSLPLNYYTYWANRTLLFCTYLGALVGNRYPNMNAIASDVQNYARVHLPAMANPTSPPETMWQTIAAITTAVFMEVSMAQGIEFVDHYVAGTAAPSLREIVTDSQVNDALSTMTHELAKKVKTTAPPPGPQLITQDVNLEDLVVAPLYRPTNADILFGALSVICGAAAIGVTVASIYTLYRAFTVKAKLDEANAEIDSKSTITDGELQEIEERLKAAGIVPVYYRKTGTDRIDIKSTYVEVQSIEEDPNKTPKPKLKTTKSSAMREPVELQSGASFEGVINKLLQNMYKIHMETSPDCWLPIADLTFIKGRIAELPAHVLRAITVTRSRLRFDPWISSSTRRPFLLNDKSKIKTLYCGEKGDERAVVVFNLHQLPSHTDVIKMFASEDQLKKMGRSKLSGFVLGLTNTMEKHLGIFSDGFVVDGSVQLDGEHIQLKTLQDCYDYPGAVSGACGRKLLHEHQGSLLIRGTHVAGSETKQVGRSVIISREFLTRICSELESQGVAYEVHLISQELSDPVVEGAYEIAPASIKTVVNTSALDRTNFVPTPFTEHDFRGGSPVRPANMNSHTLELAKAKELKRATCGEPHVDAWVVVTQFTTLLLSLFLRFSPIDIISGCKRLTCYEALSFHRKLNRFSATTSKGIRLRVRKFKKEHVLGHAEQPPDPVVRQEFENDINRYLELGDTQRVFPYQVNFDKLKDEPLEHAFVDAGKCRLFNITDFYDNVLMKIALGSLIGTLEVLFLVGPQTCGINMRGGVARDIYNTFAGLRVLAFDVSGFDNTVNSIAFPVIMSLVQRAYASRSDRLWAYWAVLSTYQSLRFDRTEGRWRGHGNTSGNWITTWLNTITNVVYFGVAVIWLACKNRDDPVSAIQALRLRVYSDDNLSSLDRPWYTPVNLKEAFDFLFHVELTNADKSLVTDASVYSIDDAEFLSRTFRLQGGLVYCPLALPSLYGQLYYVRCPRSVVRRRQFILHQLGVNLENVVSELYEYPKDKADLLASEILQFLEQRGLEPALFPYDFEFDRHAFKLSLM